MTNYERILNMSTDEMAIFFDKLASTGSCDICSYWEDCPSDGDCCVRGIKEWLESKVSENECTKNHLGKLLRLYVESKQSPISVTYGNYTLSNGANDLWWVIYYRDGEDIVTLAQSVDGEVEVCSDTPEADKETILHTILKALPYLSAAESK